jgi:prepilin-type N-terminal cleavage/methylation domain-containing protein
MRLKSEGFTLIELLVTLAIIVTLLSVATYSYYEALPGMRVKAAARELFGNLQRYRTTAMSTSTTITVTFNTATPASYTMGTETIDLDAVHPGVEFGAVAGTTPWNAGRGLDDGVTLAGDTFTIDRRGRPNKDGEIYLIHAKDLASGRKDRTYCITVTQVGTFRLLRFDGSTWQ